MNKCFWPQRANSNVYKAMSKIVYVSISPKLKKKVENGIFIIFSPSFGTLRALGVRTITRKFAVKKIRTKTCSRNTIPSPLGYLYLPNCMRSKRTIISELVTKWGLGVPYIAYTTWERVQFQLCRENLQKKLRS